VSGTRGCMCGGSPGNTLFMLHRLCEVSRWAGIASWHCRTCFKPEPAFKAVYDSGCCPAARGSQLPNFSIIRGLAWA